MLLALIIIILPVIAALCLRYSGRHSSTNTLDSNYSQKCITKKPSTLHSFVPDVPSNKQKTKTYTPSAEEPLSNNIKNTGNEDSPTTFRKTSHKSPAFVGNITDAPSKIANSAKNINNYNATSTNNSNNRSTVRNFVKSAQLWSKGVAQSAKKHDEEMRVKEQAASTERRRDALQRRLKAEKALAESDVEIVDGQFRRKSSVTTRGQNTSDPIKAGEPSKKEQVPSEDQAMSFREALRKSMGAVGSTMDLRA